MMDFKFADIGEGIHEGVILEWKYKVGDTIEEGETLVLIETDKVNAEIPSPVSGVIQKLGPKEGETVHVGETLAVIDDGTGKAKEEPKEESATPKAGQVAEGKEEKGAGVVGEIEVSDEVIGASDEHTTKTATTTKKVLATPVARKLAKDLGVDIQTVKGTGANGRVMKSDIYQAKEQLAPSKQETVTPMQVNIPTQNFNKERTTRQKISKLRKTISENMVLSKQVIPHTTIMDEVIVSDLVALRNTQKEVVSEKGLKLTFMPFIIKALTSSMKEHPVFNSSFDQANDEIVYKNYMNIGIAVDTKDGLIVPNIKDADKKSILELSKDLMEMKEKAENRTFTLEDLRDGTISITNYGIFDSTFGAPVIKFPEVAIIGIGKIAKKPVVVNDEIVIEYVLPLSLSIDHRVIDGGDAGRFLRTFKSYITNPMMLLMS
jgi:pyruvate dehydrogenase E2 component (dihydrolipoamide acetyltransferase)